MCKHKEAVMYIFWVISSQSEHLFLLPEGELKKYENRIKILRTFLIV